MPDAAPLITCTDLTYRYPAPSGQGDGPLVLDRLHLTIHPAETLAVVGPSGCGKSTLLNLIGLLDTPTSGSLRVAGSDPATLTDTQRASVRNQKIGFVFQDHHLLPQCTLLENVLIPTLPLGRQARDATARARSLLDRIGLSDRLHHRPSELSGGQRQRAAVVRALINQPLLLLADEPSGALDEASATSLIDLLIELNAETRTTLIMVTHATTLAARMQTHYRLHAGRIEPISL